MSKQRAITHLLQAYSDGDERAFNELAAAVYTELRWIARGQMRNARGTPTLQPTALVNEAFVRLMQANATKYESRSHFFRVAATVMRRILIDHARGKKRLKRGGGAIEVQFDEAIHRPKSQDADLIALDEALTRLAKVDERLSQVVELRYFAGLDIEQTAEVLGCSTGTVKRDWAKAKFWLTNEMQRNRQ